MYYSFLNTTRSAMAIFQWFLLCQKKKCFEKIRPILSKLVSEGLVKRKLTIRGLYSFGVSEKKSVLESLKLLKLSVYKYSLGVERKLFIHSQ